MYSTSVLNQGSATRMIMPNNTFFEFSAWVLGYMGGDIVTFQLVKYLGADRQELSRVYRVINWNMQGSDPVAEKILMTEKRAAMELVTQRWPDGDFVLDSDQSYCDGFWIGKF